MCLACDFGDPAVHQGPTSGPYSWGNDNALECMTDAYRFLLSPELCAKEGPVLVVGTSMGALVGLNWTLRHRDLVAGVILACPVLDLARLYRSDAPDTVASVAAAYGVEQPSALPEIGSHSPWEYAPLLKGLPIRIYSSRDDPIADDTSACRAFAERVGGNEVSVVDLGLAGHWPIDTPVEDALGFAVRFS